MTWQSTEPPEYWPTEEFSSSNLPNFDSNKGKMSSVGTLLPFNNVPGGGGGGGVGGAGGVGGGITSVGGTTQSYLDFGAPLTMLDCKMSASSPSSSVRSCSSSAASLSPVTPVNILSECYIGMWDTDLSHPPPTKLETTDIMDLIEPSITSGPGSNLAVASPSSPHQMKHPVGLEAENISPTTIIHHTPGASNGREAGDNGGGIMTSYVTSPSTSSSHNSNSPSSGSSSSKTSSSSNSSTSQYLVPLPSLGDSYGSPGDGCHLLDGFHSSMDPSFKLSDTTNAFQEGGYDAFISEMSQPPSALSHHPHDHLSHLSHHQHHPHHLEVTSSALHNNGSSIQCHENGLLLLDMSNGQPSSLHPHHPNHGGQCSPGCPCLANSAYSSSLIGGGDPFGVSPHHHPNHPHHPHHHQHELHRHSDYPSSWDDLHVQHADSADYSMLFRKGESPSTSDSVVSYTDNDSESKCSSSGGGSLSGGIAEMMSPPVKRKVGRPPKKDKKLKRNEKKTGRLWEFIRDLLKNPKYCPSLVKWENHEEGHFRFVNSEKVAQLWGDIKGNPRMTYEKLSRAMRYYYKSHVFEPVLGRRLVYKFGYNATNWKPINPNFSLPHSHHHHTSLPHHHHPHQKLYN